jgi:hypothetical protein
VELNAEEYGNPAIKVWKFEPGAVDWRGNYKEPKFKFSHSDDWSVCSPLIPPINDDLFGGALFVGVWLSQCDNLCCCLTDNVGFYVYREVCSPGTFVDAMIPVCTPPNYLDMQTLASFLIADFDGDGSPDIMSKVSRSDGSGPPADSILLSGSPTGLPAGVSILCALDIDRDGYPDLVTTSPYGIAVYRNLMK